MSVKKKCTNEFICECGNTYKTRGNYNKHFQYNKHIRYLQFAEQPLNEYSELKEDLRYSSDKLRSLTNVNVIIEKYGSIDIYTKQPLIFDKNDRLQQEYEIEHIHEVQVLVYAIERTTPLLLGKALGPLCEILNDVPNLGISRRSVNASKGGAVKYFLGHLGEPEKISFYEALTRYRKGAIRPNAHNSIREARQYKGYITGHNVYGLLADQFDLIIEAMELDLDYNTIVYDQPTDQSGANKYNLRPRKVKATPILHLNTNARPQNLFPIKPQTNNPAVQYLSNSTRTNHQPRYPVVQYSPNPTRISPQARTPPVQYLSNPTRINHQPRIPAVPYLPSPSRRILQLHTPVVQYSPNPTRINPQARTPPVQYLLNPNGAMKYKVTEMLTKQNNQYICPGCNRAFMPRGVTNHVKACAMAKTWCIQNRII